MTIPSFHDIEQLSAYLDDQISPLDKTRLEARLRSDTALASALAELSEARYLLRLAPRRSLPRNFTLNRQMKGIRPPVPRLVPALSWASVTAMLLFAFTLGTNYLGQLSMSAPAPMMAAAPMSNEAYGLGGGPAATQPSGSEFSQATPTPEENILTAPGTSPTDGSRLFVPSVASPSAKSYLAPVILWPSIWLGLAVVFVLAALLIRRANVRSFHRREGVNKKNNS